MTRAFALQICPVATLEGAPTQAAHVNAVSVPANGQRIAAAILLACENLHADLIVIGTHGHGGVEELLLVSIAQGVLHHTNVPVLLIRPRVPKPTQ